VAKSNRRNGVFSGPMWLMCSQLLSCMAWHGWILSWQCNQWKLKAENSWRSGESIMLAIYLAKSNISVNGWNDESCVLICQWRNQW
jgi:hypothetical protein